MARLDFTDRGIISVYEEMAEGNVRALERMIDNMEGRCRRHAYRSMVIFTNALIDFYEDDFQRHVMNNFAKWKDGDASLSSLAMRTGCGSEAANTGRRLMDELEDRLAGMFRRSFARVSVDTAAPVLDQRDISALQEDINALVREAEAVADQAVSSTNARGEQNAVYYLIQPVIKNTGESMCNSFRSTLSEILNGAELFGQGVNITLSNRTVGVTSDRTTAAWPDPATYI